MTIIEVQNLVPGDRVDLEGDPFADDGSLRARTHANGGFEFEVERVVNEDDSVAVMFEWAPFYVSFPMGHQLRLVTPSVHPKQLLLL